jgi:hypothetical protein
MERFSMLALEQVNLNETFAFDVDPAALLQMLVGLE